MRCQEWILTKQQLSPLLVYSKVSLTMFTGDYFQVNVDPGNGVVMGAGKRANHGLERDGFSNSQILRPPTPNLGLQILGLPKPNPIPDPIHLYNSTHTNIAGIGPSRPIEPTRANPGQGNKCSPTLRRPLDSETPLWDVVVAALAPQHHCTRS